MQTQRILSGWSVGVLRDTQQLEMTLLAGKLQPGPSNRVQTHKSPSKTAENLDEPQGLVSASGTSFLGSVKLGILLAGSRQ